MAEQDLDRNEDATPFKLSKAREKGQVAKSSDVVSCVVFLAAVVYLTWQGWAAIRKLFRIDQAVLLHAATMEPTGASIWPLIEHALMDSLMLLAPFLAVLVIAAVVANMMQTGPILSGEPIKIDFQRISPLAGFKRVFSLRTLFDTGRACIKLVLLLSVAYWALKALAPQFYGLASLSPMGYVRVLVEDLSSLGLKMALVLALIALIDLIYTRREFAKKMRMSKRELKDEIKSREGDPRIRARLRELRREAFKRSLALRKTRDADVVITNPTHFAVALRYVHGKMESPQLLAKGSGHMAAAMRELAAKHRIPVVRQPALARELYKTLAVDQSVPPALYAQVARIIVWVFAMRERNRSAAAQGAPA